MVWRAGLDMTVLADLSASIFVACFMVLLIFLGVERQRPTHAQPGEIELSEIRSVAERAILSPSAMVELLFARDPRRPGASVDIFEDRIEIAEGMRREAFGPDDIAKGIADLSPKDTVRLYVFTNRLYDKVLTALGKRAAVEMTVPLALRHPETPEIGWSPAFIELVRTSEDMTTFRRGLARLLDGSGQNGKMRAGEMAAQPPGTAPPLTLQSRMHAWFRNAANVVLPAAGFALVLWIELGRRASRRTLRSHAQPTN